MNTSRYSRLIFLNSSSSVRQDASMLFDRLQILKALPNGRVADEQIDGPFFKFVFVGRRTPGKFGRVVAQDRL